MMRSKDLVIKGMLTVWWGSAPTSIFVLCGSTVGLGFLALLMLSAALPCKETKKNEGEKNVQMKVSGCVFLSKVLLHSHKLVAS